MKRLAFALVTALALAISGASPPKAQVKQTGSVTPGHAACWSTTGVIKDCGSATSGAITSLGVTASGPAICQQSAATGAFNRICLTATATAGGVTFDNIGGATGGFTFTLNGVAQGMGTVTLPVTAGNFACFANSSGTLQDCGGSLTNPGGSNTQVQFNAAGVFGGSPNLTWVSPALTIGATSSATGQLKLAGTTSGIVAVQPQAAAGTFNFNLPTTAGTSGQCQASGGGGSSPMTWVNCITTNILSTGIGLILTNNGTAHGFLLTPKYGNQIPLFCAASSSWETFTIPAVGISGDVTSISIDGVAAQSIKGNNLQQTITVVNVANNGSGLIRLQVADSSLFSAAAGVGYIITGATGTGALPAAINSFSVPKLWTVTIIDATHVDLVGSTFTAGTYTASSATVGVGVPYFVYVKLDAGCTTATFDLSALQSYVYATVPGIAVNGGSAIEPMVGMLVLRNGTIQGGAGEEYLITWYNYGRSTFASAFTGNTGGINGTYVKLTGNIEFLIWSEHMPVVRADCSVTGNSMLGTIGFALSASGSYVRTILGQDNGIQQTQLDIAPASPKIFPVQFPFSSLTGGLWSINGWLMATEGTATAGSINPCNITSFSVF